MIKMNVLLIKHQQAAAAARLSNISERKFFSRLSRSACSSKTIFSVPFRGLSSASPRQHPFSRETKSDIILSVNTTPHDLDPQAVVSSRSARKPQALDTTLPSNNADPSCSPPLKDNPTSPEELQYTGNAVMPITSFLNIVKPQDDMPKGIWPVFRLMVRHKYNTLNVYYRTHTFFLFVVMDDYMNYLMVWSLIKNSQP
jgi:hypothetical protein